VSVGADQKPDLKPETKSDKTPESTRASSLGIDIEKAQQLEEDDLYSATPRKLENGVQPTVSLTMSNEQAESSATGATQANVKRSNTVVAELEDTEEARKRAIRLASQEEKIFYEPEDEMPKMSATSYPGQEWNPFGEQEFADWREE
jgi:serine/arginine repetitive matrix protein 2